MKRYTITKISSEDLNGALNHDNESCILWGVLVAFDRV